MKTAISPFLERDLWQKYIYTSVLSDWVMFLREWNRKAEILAKLIKCVIIVRIIRPCNNKVAYVTSDWL